MCCESTIGGLTKGGFPKGWFWRMFPQNENHNDGTFGCSPGTKTGTRVRLHVPSERKPERGYIRQNHPFTKPPFCLPVTCDNGVTHAEKACKYQKNPFSLEASVALRGRFSLAFHTTFSGAEWGFDRTSWRVLDRTFSGVGKNLLEGLIEPFFGGGVLEAQWQYFSYRVMFVAIASQNSFVLVLVCVCVGGGGYRTIIARYVVKWGIAQMCLSETKYQGRGYRTVLRSR